MMKKILETYAALIVKTGANVQPGQKVIITADIEQAPLVRLVTQEAYKAGARHVSVEWTDTAMDLLHYTYAATEELATVLPWQEAKMQQRVDDLPCMIYIESEDPDALAGADVQKMSDVRMGRMKVLKPYRDQMENKYQWVIVAAAGRDWAKKVFPELPEEEAIEQLWCAILRCVRMGNGDLASAAASDPQKAWEEHNKNFVEKCEWLNSYRFDHLHYHSSNGTDFTVGLIPTALWMGGGEYSLQNIYYNPNMPTEEIFTSPMRGRADGVLVATKPLSWQGQLIDGFSITFRDGKAVEVKAEKGQEALEQMIAMDENSAYLGEVALVPKESPVNTSGILFYNTLFDENACCHVALGHGFTNVLEGFETMTLAETVEAGVNDSMIHVDFMIGSDDLAIDGVTKEGTVVPIFRNGTWV